MIRIEIYSELKVASLEKVNLSANLIGGLRVEYAHMIVSFRRGHPVRLLQKVVIEVRSSSSPCRCDGRVIPPYRLS